MTVTAKQLSERREPALGQRIDNLEVHFCPVVENRAAISGRPGVVCAGIAAGQTRQRAHIRHTASWRARQAGRSPRPWRGQPDKGSTSTLMNVNGGGGCSWRPGLLTLAGDARTPGGADRAAAVVGRDV